MSPRPVPRARYPLVLRGRLQHRHGHASAARRGLGGSGSPHKGRPSDVRATGDSRVCGGRAGAASLPARRPFALR